MIDIARQDEIAVVKMNHGKANAMDVEFCEEIAAQFESLKKDRAKAVVLVGQGKIFSAGVDLVRALDGGPDYFRKFMPALSKAFHSVFFFPKPVVSAINGHAIAGGSVLACCADRRIMGKNAGRTGVPELAVGVPFPTIAMEIMRFSCSHHHFQEIILSAQTYAPGDAFSRGLVDELVEDADLMDRAIAAARNFAAIRAEAFAISKRQIRQPVADRYQSETKHFETAVNELWFAPEAFDRIRSYVTRTFKKA